jgi:hypothetical protein
MRGFFLEGLQPSKPPAMHTMQAEFISAVVFGPIDQRLLRKLPGVRPVARLKARKNEVGAS